MGLKLYIKRMIKYIFREYKPIIINAQIVQKESSDLLKNKIILITGGGRGLGFFMAKKAISEGAQVIITGRNEETLKNAANVLGKNCEYKVFDVKNIKEGKVLIDYIYEKYGKIDCLINNAGVSLHEGNMLNVSEDNFDNQFTTNLKGAYFLTQNYIKKYKNINQKKGNIVFISSERGSQCDDLPYGLTKVAINSLIEGLSRRFYKDGIRVNGIAPGVTASEMTGINKNDNLYAENASGRYFVPEEVAEVLMFILSDYSQCISGEVIHCNAGQHLNPWWK